MMFNNPYWAPTTPIVNPFPYLMPQPAQTVQPQPTPQPTVQQPTTPPTAPTTWNWKAVTNYQSMLMESVPFDGAPVLFMVQNEPIFYVVRMEEGRKMINGFTFTPLDNPEETALVPEEAQLESRITGLENNMNSIMTQLQKLVEGNHHEPNNEHIEAQSSQPITTKRKAVTNLTSTD